MSITTEETSSPKWSLYTGLTVSLIIYIYIIYIYIIYIYIYISYKLNPCLRNLNTDFTSNTSNNCIFESVKLTKNDDQNKYQYSGYSIGFVSRS